MAKPAARKQKRAPWRPFQGISRLVSLRGLYVRGLLAFRSLGNFELNLLAFLERLESAHLDRGKMRKQIFAAVIRGYETIPLCIIEPLHSTCWHREPILQSEKPEKPGTVHALQRSNRTFRPAYWLEDRHAFGLYLH